MSSHFDTRFLYSIINRRKKIYKGVEVKFDQNQFNNKETETEIVKIKLFSLNLS